MQVERRAFYDPDWVSLKVDAATEVTWKGINRPHRELLPHGVREAILESSRDFHGNLTTETMNRPGIAGDLVS